MSRNWGIPNATSGTAPGEQPRSHSHTSHDTQRGSTARGAQRDSNSLARHLPPGLAERNLAVIRDGSFLQKHELNPVERLDAELDHREFAACVFFAVLLTFTFGLPIAMAVAFMSFG